MADLPALRHAAKHRPAGLQVDQGNPCCEGIACRRHVGTWDDHFLGLALAAFGVQQGDDQPAIVPDNVAGTTGAGFLPVQPHQLRAAQSSSEPQREQQAVPGCPCPGAEASQNGFEVIGNQRPGLPLLPGRSRRMPLMSSLSQARSKGSPAMLCADAMAATCRLMVVSARPASARAATYSRTLAASVGSGPPMRFAPGGKLREGGSVGLPRVRSAGGAGVVIRARGVSSANRGCRSLCELPAEDVWHGLGLAKLLPIIPNYRT